MEFEKEQKTICEKYQAGFVDSPDFLSIGISRNVADGVWPIHGLRHPLQGYSTGWYIWVGEYSNADDFFVPMHVVHLKEICPAILKYLGLAPGWRFLIADNYEEVWQDNSLLEIEH